MRTESRLFFFTDTATTEIYTLSLHDALPICSPAVFRSKQQKPCAMPISICSPAWSRSRSWGRTAGAPWSAINCSTRSEEHTSELQSQSNLVCRLLLEKKKSSSHRVRLQRRYT